MQILQTVLQEATKAIHDATDLKQIEACRVHYLGKKSELSAQMKALGAMLPDERRAAGQHINDVKHHIEALLQSRSVDISKRMLLQKLNDERIDVTLPGRENHVGTLHPITLTQMKLKSIFEKMGFMILTGPEIETDYYNFTALNVPSHHPARAMQDTFYFGDGSLLRSQMSPVQIHAMNAFSPPLRMVAMGRVYRRDFDVTHTPMFHQIECLMIDESINFSNLKSILKEFLNAFFEVESTIRLRPSYFPFTEPSAEVDMSCFLCHGAGCRVCKSTGWLEVLGCGMVHPHVLAEVGMDPNRHKGFAFGAGIDRLTMLKYGIDDLRTLFENDIRFLREVSE